MWAVREGCSESGSAGGQRAQGGTCHGACMASASSASASAAHSVGKVFEHGATDRLFRGTERDELVRMAQAGARSSQSSSDFAQPKRRLVLLGSTSYNNQSKLTLGWPISGIPATTGALGHEWASRA